MEVNKGDVARVAFNYSMISEGVKEVSKQMHYLHLEMATLSKQIECLKQYLADNDFDDQIDTYI